MNLIAVDIGNSNIVIALFLDGTEKFVRDIPGGDTNKLKKTIEEAWEKIPILKNSKEKKRNGVVIASSVNRPGPSQSDKS